MKTLPSPPAYLIRPDDREGQGQGQGPTSLQVQTAGTSGNLLDVVLYREEKERDRRAQELSSTYDSTRPLPMLPYPAHYQSRARSDSMHDREKDTEHGGICGSTEPHKPVYPPSPPTSHTSHTTHTTHKACPSRSVEATLFGPVSEGGFGGGSTHPHDGIGSGSGSYGGGDGDDGE